MMGFIILRTLTSKSLSLKIWVWLMLSIEALFLNVMMSGLITVTLLYPSIVRFLLEGGTYISWLMAVTWLFLVALLFDRFFRLLALPSTEMEPRDLFDLW